MDRSKDQKELNVKVMEKMKESGSFYDLHAKLLSNLCEEIQKSSNDGLKPYKTPKDKLEYQIATDMVLRYLKKNKMLHSLKAVQTEFPGFYNFNQNKYFSESNLQFSKSDSPIKVLISEVFEQFDDIFFANRDNLRIDIQERIEKIAAKRNQK